MSYEIKKQITIHNTNEDWEYVFTNDEYGTVKVQCNEGLEAMTGKSSSIDIPRDCIQNFINALEQFK
jgi:hypothetical protein